MNTQTRSTLMLGVCLAAGLGSATAAPAPGADPGVPLGQPMLVGGDRDAHGCIGSAGYSWCERTKQCERPWELAKAKGFADTAKAFQGFCAGRKR